MISVIRKWIHNTFHNDSNDDIVIKEGIEWLYDMKKLKQPEKIIVNSPFACMMEENKISQSSGMTKFAWLALHVQSCHLSVWPQIEKLLLSQNMRCPTDYKSGKSIFHYFLIKNKKFSETKKIEDLCSKLIRGFNTAAAYSEDNLLTMCGKIIKYDFLKSIGRISSDLFDNYIKFLEAGCFFSIFSFDYAIVSRRPIFTKLNAEMALHCENGPAIKWRDGSEIYFLNGIKVPKEVVITTPDKLDSQWVITTTNAELRKEIVKKIGIDRVIKEFRGKILDEKNGYLLIKLNIPSMKITPVYLKMTNPSNGSIHFEGVPPYIRTCDEALSWRVGGLEWNPEQLT